MTIKYWARALAVLSFCSLLAADLGAQPQDLGRWISLKSQSFEIVTDASPESAVAITDQLERFRGAFSRIAPGVEMISPVPVRLLAFRGHRSYAPYKRPSDPRILGQFVRNLDGHYLTFDANYAIAAGYTVVFHEYVHFLVASNLPGVPRWFNEGLAEYYSTFIVHDGLAYVGRPIEDHVRWIKADTASRKRVLDHDFSLLEVLSGEAAHDGSKIGRFYAFSWALVHYLLSGDEQRLAKTADFLARVSDQEEPEKAFEKAFNVRLGDLEEALRSYVAVGDFDVARFPVTVDRTEIEISRVAPADLLVNLGDLQAQIGWFDGARSHYQSAFEHDPQHPDAHAGLAFVLDAEQRLDEAETLYRDALSYRSQEPRTYLRYGRHLTSGLLPEGESLLAAPGRLSTSVAFARPVATPFLDVVSTEQAAAAEKLAQRARRVFAQALEIDSSHAGAKVFFGISHLFGEVDTKPGIQALREARQWLPQNRELALYQLQLHLKAKDFKAAKRLLVTDIGEREPEVAFRAKEEVERAELVWQAGKALEAGNETEAIRLFDQAVSVTSNVELRARMSEMLVDFERSLLPE